MQASMALMICANQPVSFKNPRLLCCGSIENYPENPRQTWNGPRRDRDRLRHHAETIVIKGTSYRMKDEVNPCCTSENMDLRTATTGISIRQFSSTFTPPLTLCPEAAIGI